MVVGDWVSLPFTDGVGVVTVGVLVVDSETTELAGVAPAAAGIYVSTVQTGAKPGCSPLDLQQPPSCLPPAAN